MEGGRESTRWVKKKLVEAKGGINRASSPAGDNGKTSAKSHPQRVSCMPGGGWLSKIQREREKRPKTGAERTKGEP